MQIPTWVVVAILVAIIILLVLAVVARFRPGRRDFELRPLPADGIDAYERRLDELESLFVSKPREAVATARQLIDEMLAHMGYPARLKAADRARDIAHASRAHAKRYRTAAGIDDRSTTEEMRQSLKHFLDMGRELIAEARGRVARPVPPALERRQQEPGPAPAGTSPAEPDFEPDREARTTNRRTAT